MYSGHVGQGSRPPSLCLAEIGRQAWPWQFERLKGKAQVALPGGGWHREAGAQLTRSRSPYGSVEGAYFTFSGWSQEEIQGP